MFLECETNWKYDFLINHFFPTLKFSLFFTTYLTFLFRAPTDCLQYMTGISNSFKSFNFGNLMIRNLQYDVCIRPEAGYCRFQLMESSSSTDSFKIDPASTTTTSKVKLSFFSPLSGALQGFWIDEFQNFSQPLLLLMQLIYVSNYRTFAHIGQNTIVQISHPVYFIFYFKLESNSFIGIMLRCCK